MRRGLLAAAALALIVATGCSPDAGGGQTPADIDVAVDTPQLREMKAAAGIETCEPGPGGGELPDLTLPCLGGGPDVALDDLKGPLLINIWATSCGPCRQEMPLLQQFHEQNAGEIGVLGIDIDTAPDSAISFADAVGATYPHVADPGGFIWEQPSLGIRPGLPQTLLVDANGKVVAMKAGEFTSLGELDAFAEGVL
ncbi:hypothetical protein GCM10023340_40830 [Nocardioides marinquilinus]|uniref:Thioredoxin domain-containing protein n=1 Tax=Nocardioides marinquilinus TaxID=1210400 RepID=A0ABP9Q159_9ACTN